MSKVSMDTIANLCKQAGFIYPGSEIYDGLANTFDYGPVGVELKNNIKKLWWKKFVQESDNSFGVDASIFMNSKVWEASGHTTSFNDPKIDCKECKARFRADTLVEDHSRGKISADGMSHEQMESYIKENNIACPKCGKRNFTEIRTFNLMLSTSRGVTDSNQNIIYLRPETAQGQFVNFLNVQRTTRAKVPFGIAQIGKAFRNEITPGNFTFRTIEFEQMEHQLFCKDDNSQDFYNSYKDKAWQFLKTLGFKDQNLMFKDHEKLAHYAKAACDVFYNFPQGFAELNGIHHRSNYDLSQHQKHSGKNMMYMDPVTNEKFIPSVIEYSIGADRLTLAVLCEAYKEEKLENDSRVVMQFIPALAPYKVAVLPLQKNAHSEKANSVYKELSRHFMCTYDDTGSIGKRYRRQDQIGTPYCITIDFDTEQDNTVTLRDRDTMEQIRIEIDKVANFVKEKLEV